MRSTVRSLASYVVFPLLVGAGSFAAWLLLARGLAPGLVAFVVTTVHLGVVLGLERVLPARAEWVRADGQLWHDLGHTVFGTGLGGGIGNVLTDAVFAWLGLSVAAALPHRWPASWPLWAQVVLVYLLADLGRYVQHRLMHAVPLFWRFHALHHSGEQLTALKTSRSHFVERLFQQVFMFGGLVFLGAPVEALVWYVVPNSLVGQLDHSNVDVRLGALESVLMGPGAHRLHHSADLSESHGNYGSALVLWDRVLGTYTHPGKRPPPARVGIDGDPNPRGFLAQVLLPFRSAPWR